MIFTFYFFRNSVRILHKVCCHLYIFCRRHIEIIDTIILCKLAALGSVCVSYFYAVKYPSSVSLHNKAYKIAGLILRICRIIGSIHIRIFKQFLAIFIQKCHVTLVINIFQFCSRSRLSGNLWIIGRCNAVAYINIVIICHVSNIYGYVKRYHREGIGIGIVIIAALDKT